MKSAKDYEAAEELKIVEVHDVITENKDEETADLASRDYLQQTELSNDDMSDSKIHKVNTK